jgi:hypothetical protein
LFDREKKGYVEFKTLVQGFNLIMKGTPEEKLQCENSFFYFFE